MTHDTDCDAHYYGADCEALPGCFPASDEALAKLRALLSESSVFDAALTAMPVLLTVYTATGQVTVTVREDSVAYESGRLLAEGLPQGDTLNDCYTFVGVIGYRTRPA